MSFKRKKVVREFILKYEKPQTCTPINYMLNCPKNFVLTLTQTENYMEIKVIK